MSVAIDTNVLVRLLVREDEKQFEAARRLLDREAASGAPVLIQLMCIVETEWVLRSVFRLQKPVIASAFSTLLEAEDLRIESEATLEEALRLWASHTVEFADCILAAQAAELGRTVFATFDIGASKLPSGELIG